MSTFGLIIPGRAVDANFQQVDLQKFLITIPNADTINHIVVFLTGIIELPPQTAGCIFFSLPDPVAAPTWHYLGYLSNDKPSAIYRLSNLTRQQQQGTINSNGLMMSNNNDNGLAFNYTQAPVIHVAQVGISIEPLIQVQQMVPAIETIASKASTFREFINKTISNLYNYCSSFSKSPQELMMTTSSPSNNSQYVPLHTLKDWYDNYTRRLGNDENFWKTLS